VPPLLQSPWFRYFYLVSIFLEKFFACLLALVWRLGFLKGVPPWFLTGTNHPLRGGVKFGVRKRDKWGGSQVKRDEPRKEAGLSLGRTG